MPDSPPPPRPDPSIPPPALPVPAGSEAANGTEIGTTIGTGVDGGSAGGFDVGVDALRALADAMASIEPPIILQAAPPATGRSDLDRQVVDFVGHYQALRAQLATEHVEAIDQLRRSADAYAAVEHATTAGFVGSAAAAMPARGYPATTGATGFSEPDSGGPEDGVQGAAGMGQR